MRDVAIMCEHIENRHFCWCKFVVDTLDIYLIEQQGFCCISKPKYNSIKILFNFKTTSTIIRTLLLPYEGQICTYFNPVSSIKPRLFIKCYNRV